MKHKTKVFTILVCIILALAALLALCRYVIFKDVFEAYLAIPQITLKGDNPMKAEAGTEYEEPGYSGTVNGKDFSQKVVVDRSGLDMKKLGTYSVKYTLSNEKGRNEVTVTRAVTVEDNTPPLIKINGDTKVQKYIGGEYREYGATVKDNLDGDISSKVKISGTVDMDEAGEYTIVYTAQDSSGNKAQAKRTVTVRRVNSGKPVYLTFDDGPSSNTEKILDILKKYDAHATFFILGQNIPGNEKLIKRMASEGHTLAVHTDCHDYASIYKSTDAFWSDNEKTRARIKKITGKTCSLMRFPGGASNTISANYCKGIMSKLTNQTASHGYEYFDWNITSGDAESNLASVDKIYKNVITGIRYNYDTPVVLMHDAAAKTTTPKALEKILKTAQKEGYSFEGLDMTTEPVHHSTNN